MAEPHLEIFIPAEEIQQRVLELTEAISADFREKDVTLLGVMTGSLMFLADIMRHLEIPHQVGVIQASSYEGTATTAGELRINLDFLPPLKNRHVLLVDDILDTGQTLERIKCKIEERSPASLKTAVLLWKKCRTRHEVTPEYHGFEIEDRFVVGYGLDYDNDYRHLPDVCVVQE